LHARQEKNEFKKFLCRKILLFLLASGKIAFELTKFLFLDSSCEINPSASIS